MPLTCDLVSFKYGDNQALSQVSSTFGPGVNGLLGPNGAGKSTLLGLLATLREPTSGTVTLDGIRLHGESREAVRKTIGFLPQRFDLMRWSSVERNVSYAAWAQGVDRSECVDRAHEALEIVDLVDASGKRVASLSGGQRQRVGIACAIAHRPTLVLLDEPTAGLDPAQRVQIRSYLDGWFQGVGGSVVVGEQGSGGSVGSAGFVVASSGGPDVPTQPARRCHRRS